jgi:hypothetical protein
MTEKKTPAGGGKGVDQRFGTVPITTSILWKDAEEDSTVSLRPESQLSQWTGINRNEDAIRSRCPS